MPLRYAQIRSMDISNGENIGIALFVQGCHFHCYNCFNKETWSFNKGYKWTDEAETRFFELINKPFISRISILGGEPLADENVEAVLNLINKISVSFPEKTIWLYTGYTWDELFSTSYEKDYICTTTTDRVNLYRRHIVKNCDVLIDGRYIDSERDLTLKWRGSKNQRVIDVQKSLTEGKVINFCD